MSEPNTAWGKNLVKDVEELTATLKEVNASLTQLQSNWSFAKGAIITVVTLLTILGIGVIAFPVRMFFASLDETKLRVDSLEKEGLRKHELDRFEREISDTKRAVMALALRFPQLSENELTKQGVGGLVLIRKRQYYSDQEQMRLAAPLAEELAGRAPVTDATEGTAPAPPADDGATYAAPAPGSKEDPGDCYSIAILDFRSGVAMSFSALGTTADMLRGRAELAEAFVAVTDEPIVPLSTYAATSDVVFPDFILTDESFFVAEVPPSVGLLVKEAFDPDILMRFQPLTEGDVTWWSIYKRIWEAPTYLYACSPFPGHRAPTDAKDELPLPAIETARTSSAVERISTKTSTVDRH